MPGSSDGEDAIHLFALRWDGGPAPGQESVARLMDRAAIAIDRWFAARL